MAVQVNQVSKTSDFTNQYSSAQKTQQADGSNFMTFLKDARKLDKSSQDSNQAEEKLFGDEVKESADVPAAELLVDEASVEMPGRFNPDQDDVSQDQSTELMTALLMGGFVAPENADQTVAQELGQEMTREMSLGAVQNPDATTILSSIMANQDGKVTEMPVLAEEAFSDDLTSQLENTLVGQDVDLLNKQKTKLDSALRQVKESTEVITDDARADQPLGRTDQISVESQEKSAEAGKTISLNGIDLQEETVEAPSVETDGKQVDVQSLLGVKSTAPATKAEPAQLLSQVQDAIVENFELNTDKTFKVTLNPERLGEIDVEMAFSNGNQTAELLTALLMGGLVAPENAGQTVAAQVGQEVSTEMLTGTVRNPDSETMVPIVQADQDQQLAETLALVEAALSDDMASQVESSLVEQDSALLSKRDSNDILGSRQVNALTDTTTDATRVEQPVGKMSETTVGIQGSTDEASKTISLNGSGLQEETAEAPSVEADGKQLDVQSLLGVKSTAPATKAEPAQLLSQVQDAIVENFELNTDKTFKVTLNPESLGEIDVEMAFSNGKLTINILAASQETHELLSKQIDQLVRGLALQKVSVETVTINRSVEETADSGQQAQSGMTNMDFKQGQQQEAQSNLIGGKFNRMARIGLTSGESLDESLTDLANISAQSSRFSRLNYLV